MYQSRKNELNSIYNQMIDDYTRTMVNIKSNEINQMLYKRDKKRILKQPTKIYNLPTLTI